MRRTPGRLRLLDRVVRGGAAAALVLVVACGRGKPVAREAEGDVRVFVSLERVEARAGPSAEAARQAALPRGTEIRLRGYTGGWARIVLPTGREAWVPAGSFERLQDREARKARTEAVAGFAPQAGRLMENAVFFLAPDYGAAQYEGAGEGAGVEVLLVDHDFYGVLLPGKVLAFVPSRSVRLLAVPPTAEPHEVAAAPQQAPGPPGPGGAGQGIVPPPGNAEGATRAQAAPAPAEPGRPPVYEALPPDSEAPVLKSRVDPRYPEFARKAGLSGDVQVRILVEADGRVGRVEVVSGGPGGMTEAATDAVRRWVYEPARVAGRPVAVWKVVRIHFSIDGRAPRDGEKPPL